MTESVLTAPATKVAPETTLTEFLAQNAETPSRSQYDCVLHSGTLTPQHLDAPTAETAALFRGAAAHDLGWLRRVAVRGEDRLRWLSGMVTNAVDTIAQGHGAYNLVLNAQGRIQGDAYVWRSGTDPDKELEIEIDFDQCEPLLTHFDRFIIMDDVELELRSNQSALGLTGPRAAEVLTALGLPVLTESLTSSAGLVAAGKERIPVQLYRRYGTLVPHFALWVQDGHVPALWKAMLAAGATPVGSASQETLRVAEGIPAYGIDIQSRDLVQETSQMRAISFTKGCYLGQEIVERVRSRGQVHKNLRALELFPDQAPASAHQSPALPSPGLQLEVADSIAGSKPAATLTSVAALELDGRRRIFAIAVTRTEAEVGNRPLTFPGGTAHILNAPPKLTPA